MADPKPRVYVNVPVSAEDARRIERDEHTWSSTRLVGLCAATLGTAFVVLYLMAQTTSETYWADWLFPG